MNGVGNTESRIRNLHQAEDVLGAAMTEAVEDAIGADATEIPLPARLTVRVEVEVLPEVEL